MLLAKVQDDEAGAARRMGVLRSGTELTAPLLYSEGAQGVRGRLIREYRRRLPGRLLIRPKRDEASSPPGLPARPD